MFSIYTRTNNPFKKEFMKWAAKKIIQKYSGPDAVLDSLTRGLGELHIPFEINPYKPTGEVIHVLSGIEALKDAIKHKTADQIIVAGPNIFVTPLDYNKIILDPKIDIALSPSPWVTDLYLSYLPDIKYKIHTWASGVKIPPIISTKKGKVILLKKNIQTSIFEEVVSILHERSIAFELLEYGNFTHEEYLKKLETAPYMIYLQKSESQGLALQEAWSYNVPTLVFQSTQWNFKDYTWNDPKIAAPYLYDELGSFFILETLSDCIDKINTREMKPQCYCKEYLSDEKSAQNLLTIIKAHHEKNN